MDQDNNLKKLEEDLQKVTAAASTVPQPVTNQPAAPLNEVPTVSPPIPEPISTPQSPVAPPQTTVTPPANLPVEEPKKGFSIVTLAIVLMVIAIVVSLGYVFYVQFSANSQVVTPTPVVVNQTIAPTMMPVVTTTPMASVSASPKMSPTPVSSPSATPVKSATPSATPKL